MSFSPQPPPLPLPYQPPVARPTSSSATTSLVMGILGIVLCPFVCSCLALYFAAQAEREIAQYPWMDGASSAKAGKVLGIVGLVLSTCVVLFYVVLFALAIASTDFSA